ncbi:MAG: ribosome recycling factor [Polaribacter sp.]|jgi:ribosome recycling factor
MQEEINIGLAKAKEEMEDAISHLHRDLAKIRAGKASPAMLNGIMVDYYGNPTPLTQVANVSAPDSKMLNIAPWEKSMIGPIEQAIFAANLGVTPQNNGESIIINIPPLTEERRISMVKTSKGYGEDAKISFRNSRHKIMDFIKKSVKEGYPEDAGKRSEEEVEKLVKHYVEEANTLIAAKEKDVMTI